MTGSQAAQEAVTVAMLSARSHLAIKLTPGPYGEIWSATGQYSG